MRNVVKFPAKLFSVMLGASLCRLTFHVKQVMIALIATHGGIYGSLVGKIFLRGRIAC
jgi:hypothetical protein